MSLPVISVAMKLKPGSAPGLTPDFFYQRVTSQGLKPFFTPREIRGFVNRVPVSHDLKSGEQWNRVPLWKGESVIPDFPLSHLDADSSLFSAVAPGNRIELQFYGGLFHQPPVPGAIRDWYGRILTRGPSASAPWLSSVIAVRLDWNDFGRAIWVSFPFAGYPLTSIGPQVDDSFTMQPTAMTDVVLSNRGAFTLSFNAMAGVLECSPADMVYQINWKEALSAGDQEALRELEFQMNAN